MPLISPLMPNTSEKKRKKEKKKDGRENWTGGDGHDPQLQFLDPLVCLEICQHTGANE